MSIQPGVDANPAIDTDTLFKLIDADASPTYADRTGPMEPQGLTALEK